MELPSASETPHVTGGDVPYVTAAQASALLKSGMAISNELIGTAFPELAKTILDDLSGKWDFDVGSPLVHEGSVLAEGTIDQVSQNERVVEVYLGR